jgi:FlaG/FlaF family flagellin (archaellin)
MKSLQSKIRSESGVSPVIGVVLMVTVTVAVVGLVGVVVFNLQGDVSESPDASVEFENGDTVTLLRNQNVETIEVRDSSGAVVGSMSEVGDIVELGTTDEHQVVAIMPDGTEQVIKTIEADAVQIGESVVLDGSNGSGSFVSTVSLGEITTG